MRPSELASHDRSSSTGLTFLPRSISPSCTTSGCLAPFSATRRSSSRSAASIVDRTVCACSDLSRSRATDSSSLAVSSAAVRAATPAAS
eukprot:2533315-Prymnesium_polylepis.1